MWSCGPVLARLTVWYVALTTVHPPLPFPTPFPTSQCDVTHRVIAPRCVAYVNHVHAWRNTAAASNCYYNCYYCYYISVELMHYCSCCCYCSYSTWFYCWCIAATVAGTITAASAAATISTTSDCYYYYCYYCYCCHVMQAHVAEARLKLNYKPNHVLVRWPNPSIGSSPSHPLASLIFRLLLTI